MDKSPEYRHHVTRDGRRLAFAEYGEPAGSPVIYCHGFPGSRLEARFADHPARQLGIRLIAPDRPGFGRSDFLPGRRLADWPGDMTELADHLALPTFDVLGVSGGAPYAIACGQALDNRVGRIALVCGLGEFVNEDSSDGMNAAAAAAIRLQMRWPRLGHWSYRHLIGPALRRHPERVFRILLGHATPADHEVLSDPGVRSMVVTSFVEAFRQGSRGPAHEIRLITRAWDIDPRLVDQAVSLWHGQDDRTVPIAMGRRHAALLPRVSAHYLPDEGHFSLIFRHMREILRDLVR